MDARLNWITEKPNYACVFVSRNKWKSPNHQNGKEFYEYIIYRFAWEKGEGDGDWYLAWLTEDGEEYDAYEECKCYEYLVLEILPTMDETHKEWVESVMKNNW